MHVVLLYHIEKTGGTALKHTLVKEGYANFFYGTHYCFEGLPWHGSVFENVSWPDDAGSAWGKSCKRVARLRHLPHDAKVVVEFHSWSKGVFWSRFVPRQKALHALHARMYGGSVRSLTTLRDPTSHQRSFYLMWPPRVLSKSNTYIRTPYIRWLRENVAKTGLQTRLITGNWKSCDVHRARARLNMLTDVQLLSHLNLTSYCGPKCSLVQDRPVHGASRLEERATDAEIALHKKEVRNATHCDHRLVRVMFPSLVRSSSDHHHHPHRHHHTHHLFLPRP